jgi:hypothetical protein
MQAPSQSTLARTTHRSRFGTLDWVAALESIVLLAAKALLLVNGTCSRPAPLSAERRGRGTAGGGAGSRDRGGWRRGGSVYIGR